jgi:predicted RNase H-like HicB family nuclease
MSIAAHDRFNVIHKGVEYQFEVAEEGGYVVSVPAYPSCASQGETFEEALENVEDALRETLAAARELGLEVPEGLASA